MKDKENIIINDIVKSWEYLFIEQKKDSNLKDFFDYISKIKKIDKKVETNIEKLMIQYKEGSYWRLIFSNNQIIKRFYEIFEKRFLTMNTNESENIDQISIILFVSIIYCIKNDNWLWNTLYSQIYNKLKIIYKNKKDIKYIQEIAGYIINSAEFTNIVIKFKKEKTLFFNLNNELKDYLNKYMLNIELKLPMIVEPRDWERKKFKIRKKSILLNEEGLNMDIDKNDILYEGGYLNNKYLEYYFEPDKNIEYSSYFLESINYIQQIPLKINKKYLSWLKEQNIDILFKEYDILKVEHIKLYINNKIKELDINIANIINEIGCTLYIATIFSRFEKIFFPIFIDFRGRHYCASYPLQYYANKMFKGLFAFTTKKELKEKEFYKMIEFLKIHSGSSDLFDKYLNEKKIFYSEKHFFNYMSISLSPENGFIGLDASASAFQIQGLLLRDELMLKLTNIFPGEKKEDIYIFIMERLYENIRNNNLFDTIWIEINELEKFNLFYDKVEFITFIEKLLKDRKIWKSLIMKLGYNQGNTERSEDLYNYILQYYIKVLTKKRNKKFLYLTFWLGLELEKTFYKIFPKQKMLRKYIWKIVSILYKEKKGVLFYSRKFHKITQYYYKKEYKEIWSTSWVNKKKHHFRFITSNYEKLDYSKMKTATLPNFIQYLDSIILTEFIKLAQKENIEVKTIHDCFYTHWSYISKLNELYKKAIMNIFFRGEDLLFALLIINNLHQDKELINLYQNLTKDFNNNKYYTENIIKSKWALTI